MALPYSSPADAMKGGAWGETVVVPPNRHPAPRPPTPCSSSRHLSFLRSHSNTLASRIVLSRDQPSHIRSGEEAKHLFRQRGGPGS